MTPWITIACPYCGETFDTAIDVPESGTYRSIEDCAICCRPIDVIITLDDDGTVSAQTFRDDETG